MNDGIKILLERIKTHPEEFLIDNNNPFAESKWRKILQAYKSCLPKEDMEALDNEINKLLQEKFTSAIMEELLDPKEEAQLTLTPTPQKIGTPRGGATLGAYSNLAVQTQALQQAQAVQNTMLHELLRNKKLAELETHKKEEKKHTTLFGRLFNYT